MCKGKAEQPLFEGCCSAEMAKESSPDATRRAGQSLVTKLLKVRQSLAGDESLYRAHVNACIDTIRGFSEFSDTKREELVLYAIERQGATTPTEIAEDTRLDPEIIKGILIDLHARGIVYQVKKYIPGSGRPWTMLKSRRAQTPEGTTELFAVEKRSEALAAAA